MGVRLRTELIRFDFSELFPNSFLTTQLNSIVYIVSQIHIVSTTLPHTLPYASLHHRNNSTISHYLINYPNLTFISQFIH